MIARISGLHINPQYVALCWDDNRQRWRSITGDAGRCGDSTERTAIARCGDHLAEQLAHLAEQAAQLDRLCDRRQGLTPDERHQQLELARDVAAGLQVAACNAKRLIDAPTDADRVDIDASYEALPGGDAP
jgi:hypothetical protein